MCYPTNKPGYTPPPRRAGLSKEPSTGGQRGGLQRGVKRQRQRCSCGIALYSQSLFARSASLLWALIWWSSGEQFKAAPESWGFIRKNAREKRGSLVLVLSLGAPAGKRPSEREPSCADRASPKETWMLRNRRGRQRKSLEASRVLFGLFP